QPALACGTTHYDLLLRDGHQCVQSRVELLRQARSSLDDECRRRDEMAAEACGSWSEVQNALANDHPSPEQYLETLNAEWRACRQTALTEKMGSGPAAP